MGSNLRGSAKVSKNGFSLVRSIPMDSIKGFKDEIRFAKKWLQDIYTGKRPFRYKAKLDSILSLFAGHILFQIFRKEPFQPKAAKVSEMPVSPS